MLRLAVPLRNNTHMASMNIVLFSRPGIPNLHLHPECLHSLDIERPILNEVLSPIFSNKLWNYNRTVHVNERTQKKNITESCHIQINHAFYCSI